MAWSGMVRAALEAAERIAAEGVDVEVVDLRTLRPLDADTLIGSVRKTGRCLVVEEAPVTGGFGGEVAALVGQLGFDHLDAPVSRLGAPETPVPYSRPLEAAIIPDPEAILAAGRRLAAW